MIIEQSSFCNFAKDNTLHLCGEKLTERNILNWFRLNSIKANSEKFQSMIHKDKSQNHILKINSNKAEASDALLLLGIVNDRKYSLNNILKIYARKHSISYMR